MAEILEGNEEQTVIRERTLEEKVDYLIGQVAVLNVKVAELDRAVLPQPPDPEIGLP